MRQPEDVTHLFIKPSTHPREFHEFVSALLALHSAKLISDEEVRLALADWGMRLQSPVRAPMSGDHAGGPLPVDFREFYGPNVNEDA